MSLKYATEIPKITHSVQPPSPFLLGGGFDPSTKLSKRGRGLTGPQHLEGSCWERGGDLFQGGGGGGCNSHQKKIKI